MIIGVSDPVAWGWLRASHAYEMAQHEDDLSRTNVEADGLISSSPDFIDLSRRLADYVDPILKGANPGYLLIDQPTKFQVVINRKMARTLGLAIPQLLLLSAEIIE